ncbi:unnamed protein product [Caenorhabditis brenneri]
MSQPGPINRKRKRVGWDNELAVVIPRMEEQLINFEDEDKDMHDVVLVVEEKKTTQIFIKVLVTKDSFEMEVYEAEHRKYKTPQEEVISDLEKFEHIHEIRNREHEVNRKAENLTWERVGLLEFVGYNNPSIQGYRPIFELLDVRQFELLDTLS